MDAAPYLRQIARKFEELALEAILIGNAAAAIQGAPVSTISFDFLISKSPTGIPKLKGFARAMGFVIFVPYFPRKQMYRLMRESDSLQLDFCVRIDGIRSYESLRSRATAVSFGDKQPLVASLADVIKSKRAAGRPQDLAILVTLEEVNAKIEAREKAKTARPEKAV